MGSVVRVDAQPRNSFGCVLVLEPRLRFAGWLSLVLQRERGCMVHARELIWTHGGSAGGLDATEHRLCVLDAPEHRLSILCTLLRVYTLFIPLWEDGAPLVRARRLTWSTCAAPHLVDVCGVSTDLVDVCAAYPPTYLVDVSSDSFHSLVPRPTRAISCRASEPCARPISPRVSENFHLRGFPLTTRRARRQSRAARSAPS